MMVQKLTRLGAIALVIVAGVPAQVDADPELVSGEAGEAKQALIELGRLDPS